MIAGREVLWWLGSIDSLPHWKSSLVAMSGLPLWSHTCALVNRHRLISFGLVLFSDTLSLGHMMWGKLELVMSSGEICKISYFSGPRLNLDNCYQWILTLFGSANPLAAPPSACVYVFVYVCMSVYISVLVYVYVCVCLYICVCTCICLYLCIHVCGMPVYVCLCVFCKHVCMCIYVCVYVYIYVCVSVCMLYIHVCMCMCIYMYVCAWTQALS